MQRKKKKPVAVPYFQADAHTHSAWQYLLIDNLTPPPQLTAIDKIISGQLIKACHQSLIMG